MDAGRHAAPLSQTIRQAASQAGTCCGLGLAPLRAALRDGDGDDDDVDDDDHVNLASEVSAGAARRKLHIPPPLTTPPTPRSTTPSFSPFISGPIIHIQELRDCSSNFNTAGSP